MSEAFGMMEGAYFVGRREILEWINSTLDLNLTKIEETASGCVALQLLDSLHPGKVAMSKVNWAAKQEHEFVQNYKLLQKSFDSIKIDKHIDVDKLIRAKYQDNLEFMQWFKRFYEVTGAVEGYDAVAARSRGKGAPSAATRASSTARPKPRTVAAKVGSSAKSRPAASGSAPAGADSSRAAEGSRGAEGKRGSTSSTGSSSSAAGKGTKVTAASGASRVELKAKDEEIQRQAVEIEDLKANSEALEKERDFYFEKLRDVEILLQLKEEKGMVIECSADMFKILYASTEDIVAVNDEGDVIEGEEARLHKEGAAAAAQAEEGEA